MNYGAAALMLGMLVSPAALGQQVREDTKIVGLYVESVKKTSEEFKTSRDLIAKAAVRNTNILEENSLRSEQAVQKVTAVWRVIGDKERLALFDGLRAAPDQVLSQRRDLEAQRAEHKKLLDTARTAIEFRIDKLTEAATTLAKLGERRSTSDQVRFYVSFIKEVRGSISKLAKDAEAAAITAEQTLNQKAGD